VTVNHKKNLQIQVGRALAPKNGNQQRQSMTGTVEQKGGSTKSKKGNFLAQRN